MTKTWQDRFDEMFVHSNIWKSDNEDTAYVAIGNIKSFIQEEIDRAVEERTKEIKKEIEKRDGWGNATHELLNLPIFNNQKE